LARTIPQSPRRAFLLSAISSACFAGMFASLKLLPPRIGSLESLFYRGLIGVITCAAVLRIRGARFRPGSWRVNLLRSLCGVIAILCQYFAIHEAGCELATANLLSQAAPLWILLLSAPILGERPGPRAKIALAVGLLGTALALGPSHASERLGLGLALTSGAFSAFALLSVRKLASTEDATSVVLFFMGFAALVMLPFAAAALRRHGVGEPRELLLLLLVGGLGTAGQLFMTQAYRYASASTVSIAGLLQVVFAAVLSFTLIGAPAPSWTAIAGGILVVTAGLFVTEPWKHAGLPPTRANDHSP
jgi:drug/metabolite transporter (DMT)-like permease